MFAGEIVLMPGSNPRRLNSRAENEIENGREPPPKYIEECSGPRKQGKNKKEAQAKDRSGTVPIDKLNARGYFGTAEGHGSDSELYLGTEACHRK